MSRQCNPLIPVILVLLVTFAGPPLAGAHFGMVMQSVPVLADSDVDEL